MKNIEESTVQRVGLKGIVKMQLRDKDGNIKQLFQGNKIWDRLHKAFGIDLKIPFLTGKWTTEEVIYNTITNAGLSEAAKLLGGIAADPVSYMGLGTGTPTGTALQSEITDGGGERAAVTPTSQDTNVTGDTNRSVKTFAFTDSFAITEEALFNASSSGDMIASRSFSVVNVGNGDSLQITHDLVMTAV